MSMDELNIKIEFILNQMIVYDAQNKKKCIELDTKIEKCIHLLETISNNNDSFEKRNKTKNKSTSVNEINHILPPIYAFKNKIRKIPSDPEKLYIASKDASL